ncbi:transcriptional repressor general negative regulator of transcription subunit 4, partial [Teratosphaeriaceae sp. CCFEE 6253]
FVFNASSLPQADLDIIKNYPPLFDKEAGARRRLRRVQREEEQRRLEQEAALAFQQQHGATAEEEEDNPEMSGSLQLGGEPEERHSLGGTARPPGIDAAGALDPRFQFGGVSSPGPAGDRGLTPQQRQQLLLQTMKTSGDPSSYPAHQPPGHQRNVSRFSFANDTASASAS